MGQAAGLLNTVGLDPGVGTEAPVRRALLLAPDGVRNHVRAALKGVSDLVLLAEAGPDAVGLAQASRPALLLVAGATDEQLEALRAAVPDAALVDLGAPSCTAEIRPVLRAALVPPPTVDRVEPRRGDEPPAAPAGRNAATVLVVYSPRGGSGRSTLAVNLAIALQAAGDRETWLVDGAGARGELDLLLDLAPAATLAGWTPGASPEALACAHPGGVRLLAAGGTRLPAPAVATLIAALRRRNAWVVVDTDPGDEDGNAAWLMAADRVIVPFRPEVPQLRALRGDLARWRARGVGVEAFDLRPWAQRGDLRPEDVALALGRAPGGTLAYDPVAALEGINRGVPAVLAAPGSALARDVEALAQSLVQPTTALVPVATGPLASLWARLRAIAARRPAGVWP